MYKIFIIFGGLYALIAVITRSLSSHAIHNLLEQRNTLLNFNLAADYMLFHGIALILLALLMQLNPDQRYVYSCWLITFGCLFFCTTVLLKSCFSIEPFGILTPFGGLLLMAGWLWLILATLLSMK